MMLSPGGFLAVATFLALVLLGPVVVQAVKRQPRLGWCSLLVALGVSAFVALPSASIGPIAVAPIDGIVYVLLLAGLWRVHDQHMWKHALVFLLALFALNIIRSFATFGFGATDLSFRAELFFISAALFASTLEQRHLIPLARDVRLLAFVYLAALFARWVGLSEGIEGPVGEGAFFEQRAVPASFAALMAFGLVYSLWSWLRADRTRLAAASTIVFAFGVLLTRHRSVWVATLVAIGVLLLASPRTRRRATAIGVSVAAALVLTLASARFLPEFAGTVTSSASDTRTWEWRQEVWAAMWGQHLHRGPVSFLLGSTYGNPWDENVAGPGTVGYSPHNFYIRVSIRLGIISALLLFGLYVRTFVRAVRSRRAEAALVASVIALQLTYSVAYDPGITLALLFGASVAWATRPGLRERTPHDGKPRGPASTGRPLTNHGVERRPGDRSPRVDQQPHPARNDSAPR